jgi:DNA-binding transcriptional MerR regulator/effector-binding domain-containing protein
MYSIGEFSRITGLTVKTLRFYADEGLLPPACIDPDTGYRYYDDSRIDRARIIAQLRELEVPLAVIAEILAGHEDDADVLGHLVRHQARIEARLQRYRDIAQVLQRIITSESEAKAMTTGDFQVQEKQLGPVRIAAVRMQGRYDECGAAFARIGRALGRFICGKPLLLHYDTEYKESDADFEACMPVRDAAVAPTGISIRELAGGRCVSLLHKGPYDQLGRSYERILRYVHDRGYKIETPTREVYLKGPGLIFRGNPKRYLTEIQILIGS